MEETWLTKDIWNNMDKETSEFAFSQGEKYLTELKKVSDSITNRSYMLLGIIIAVCPFLITTILNFSNQFLIGVAYFFTSICIGVSIALIGLTKPWLGSSVGRDPKSLIRMEDLQHYRATKDNSSFVKYELENLQNKIEKTDMQNKQRAQLYKIVLFVIIGSFSLLLLLVLIFKTFSYPL